MSLIILPAFCSEPVKNNYPDEKTELIIEENCKLYFGFAFLSLKNIKEEKCQCDLFQVEEYRVNYRVN